MVGNFGTAILTLRDQQWFSFGNNKNNKHKTTTTLGKGSRLTKNDIEPVIPVRDIVVVGGGPAGLLTTYLFSKHKHYGRQDIMLVEKLNRIGGNILSTNISYNDKNIYHLSKNEIELLNNCDSEMKHSYLFDAKYLKWF